VPEVVAARDEGIRVLVLRLVTNMVVGFEQATRGRGVWEELDAKVRRRQKFCGESWNESSFRSAGT